MSQPKAVHGVALSAFPSILADSFFHIHGTGVADMITVRADGEVGFKRGDEVFLTPREDAIHKFDAQGLRLE